MPHEAADEEKRPGVTKSRVAIAFPMDPTNGQAVPAVQGGADASCLAFAYLPVCPSGLRFLVQVCAAVCAWWAALAATMRIQWLV